MPSSSAVHVSIPLTNLSIAWQQAQTDFVAGQVFPLVSVQHKSDLYYEYDRADWMRVVAKKRAAKSESAGGDYSLKQSTYSAVKYAVHYDVSDEERANADIALNPDVDATNWTVEQLLRLREQEWGTEFFQAGVWGTDITGVSGAPAGGQAQQWNEAGSTPIEDVSGGRIAVAQVTGRRPGGMVITPAVFDALKNHADVLDRIKYTQTGIVTEQLLASLFDLDQVMVAWGMGATSEEGAATDTFDFMLGKHALLYHTPNAPGLRVPAAGYTFGWSGLLGAASAGGRVKRFRIEEIEADRIENEMAWDMKLVAADLGYFFDGIVA